MLTTLTIATLLVGSAILVVLAVIRFNQIKSSSSSKNFDLIQAWQKESQAQRKALVMMEKRLEAIEQRLEKLGQWQERTDGGRMGGDRFYEQAVRLVDQGADAQHLVRTYGLSQGEAELIVQLHRAQRG
ncbi:MAG: DUF2802 domain-containing protein [Pseudomonadota bacterium]|nr:DUF2802 domain-containing protein [Pseudomonadota bacterium]